ncbi:hypothetical protein [Pseudoalteromonas luteoviolacea]|uniref:Uncharacterized protein n=1 Tax=Pseudoalteromonas luteoviolacea H33 TaxID=1365251 RepID=A0A167CSR3_9GAMM|nr:hypothetical protein [Pseudoalteromonas luteoviolacea]KZN48018.1 hypothetical protein N476_22500 [Pseudoalteromonas luteoviolacea H33]KZN73800.1 hypothetical protein N477_22860 [Pseudoalteromonas luteoviolacea H33-S]MBQ4878292.1 hypothetical protein [Pseudoalteromonas luteoviolacea]MBQ4907447.1 hypothetical protein [Pseudoalteromonas luteoviolacea]
MDFHQVIAKDAFDKAYQSASAEFAVKAMILKHSPANIDNLTEYIDAGRKFIAVCLSGHDLLLTTQLRMWFRRNLVLNSSRGSANLKFKHICRAELMSLDKHLKVVFSYYGDNITPLLPQVK